MPPQPISACIVGDEFQSQEVFSLILADIFPDIKIEGMAGTLKDVLAIGISISSN